MIPTPGNFQGNTGFLTAQVTKLQSNYQKPNFKFFLGKIYAENKQGQIEFQKNVSKTPIQNSYQFILSNDFSIWVPYAKFAQGLLSPTTTVFDLSVIHKVFGSYDMAYSAIQFCSTCTVLVNEQKQLLPFLMSCLILNVEKPIQQFNKFLELFQDYRLDLIDKSEILDLIYFCQECKGDPNLNYLVLGENKEFDNNKFPFRLQEHLIKNNPLFYYTQDNQISPKIHNLSQLEFKSFLDGIFQQLFTLPQGMQYASFESVQFFRAFIEFYFLANNNPEDNARELVQCSFGYYYDQFKPLLKEETIVKCLPYFPQETSQTYELLNEKVEIVKEIKLRERVFINVLIQQRSKRTSLLEYREQFINSFQMMSGKQISDRIINVLDYEINRLMQLGQQ